MTGEQIFGMIIWVMCGFGCAGIFFGIGVWANKRKDPVHFYSGVPVKAETISDIPAYNRANARMWKIFSIPFWFMGIFGILSIWLPWSDVAVLVSAVYGCTVHLIWLVLKYHKIQKQFKRQ